jgi:hypothetical protein
MPRPRLPQIHIWELVRRGSVGRNSTSVTFSFDGYPGLVFTAPVRQRHLMHGGFWHRFRCPTCNRSTSTLRLEDGIKAVCYSCARYRSQPPLPLAERYRSDRYARGRRAIALALHHLRARAEALEPFK